MITDMEKLKIILYDFWLIDTGTCTFLRLSLHSVTLLTAETRNEIIQYSTLYPETCYYVYTMSVFFWNSIPVSSRGIFVKTRVSSNPGLRRVRLLLLGGSKLFNMAAKVRNRYDNRCFQITNYQQVGMVITVKLRTIHLLKLFCSI